MSLFQSGFFQLHSGDTSDFLVECNDLSNEDIRSLARFIAAHMPPFGAVEGIAQGGLRLAAALLPYIDFGSSLVLIVDDVLTTGASMEEQRAGREDVAGVVLFARGPYPTWVRPMFVMPGRWHSKTISTPQ